MSLSVVINTKNTAKTLARALKSVSFADEIIVVDMHSQDDTVKIARKYTDHIFTFDDVGYVEPARNFALSKATSDWILVIDADEEVSPGLEKLIQGIVDSKNQVELPDCFYVPRKNLVFDKWITLTGWWPDYQLRLFRKDHVEWSDQIHSVPITRGEVKELPAREDSALLHHNYQSVEQFVDRLNRYTSVQSKQATDKKVTITASSLLEAFQDDFLRRFFQNKGIEEGVHGAALSLLQSFYQTVVQMKTWEKQGFAQPSLDPRDSLATLQKFRKELAYWISDWQVHHTTGLANLWWRLRRKLMT